MLAGRLRALVGQEGRPVLVLATLDAQALARLTDDPVSIECPLLQTLVPEEHDRRHSTTCAPAITHGMVRQEGKTWYVIGEESRGYVMYGCKVK